MLMLQEFDLAARWTSMIQDLYAEAVHNLAQKWPDEQSLEVSYRLIEGFDDEIAAELSERAKNFVTIENERIESSLRKHKIKDDLYNFEDLSKLSLLKLVENNIKTLDDLAELDSEELFNLLGDKTFINEDDAGSVIMKARQHWFAEDKIDQ